MRLLRILLCIGVLHLSVAASAFATTKEEMIEFVKKAVEHIKTAGLEKALQDFNTPGNEWHKGELYIYAYKFDGTNLALGSNPKVVGKNLIDLKTADGAPLIKDMVNLTKEKGEAWYEYSWPHPETKKVEKKVSYFVKIPNEEGFVGSGIYLGK